MTYVEVPSEEFDSTLQKLVENPNLLKSLETIYNLLEQYRITGDLWGKDLRKLRRAMIDFINLTSSLEVY